MRRSLRRMTFVLVNSCLVILLSGPSLHAAEVVRNYPLGEDDRNAAVGEEATFTSDVVEFLADLNAEDGFADLEGFGTYVEGRTEDSEFAMSFNGTTDFFTGPAFDPRHFNGSFTALSQAWVKPSPDGEGIAQTVWALGGDNGGVAITEDGFWQLNSGGSAGEVVSQTAVNYDEWNHLAVLRGGNNGTLYLNGGVIARNDGFWNGPGTLYLGVGVNEEEPFFGVIDDFLISGFGDGSFDQFADIKFDFQVCPNLDVNNLDPCIMDQDDYAVWSDNVGFNNEQGVGDISTLYQGDVDDNGRVDFFDLLIIRELAMQAANPQMAVPEPTSLLMTLLAVVMLGVTRTRTRVR